MADAYIGLGSNLGDRLAILRRAVDALGSLGTVRSVSPLYETKPIGYAEQPWFLNAVAHLDTALHPEPLLTALKRIERDLGRRPSFRYGPREVDLDLLLYDDLIRRDAPPLLPHPSLHERAFVLQPLADLAPALLVPGHRATVLELLARLDPAERAGVRLRRRRGWPADAGYGG
jgi:2-amino-4-hydroxy-6-hydroxymethyldihydropteridine diphosphokinase